MFLPNWLYSSLPYLYLIAGTITVLRIEHPISFISGGLFVAAGSLVFHWRRTYAA